MSIGFLFAWYDLWIGAYWDRKAHWLYIMIPMCGIILKFKPGWGWYLKTLHNNSNGGKSYMLVDKTGKRYTLWMQSEHWAYVAAWQGYKLEAGK